ncbi:4Fe-4S single cluster domain-containing protein [Allorhizocola rhizosphaerae]|uniref:4Fe-4S single cluster domain-containing protein n=1 Tax=Allorhizocola rhizosphaerae TaxID=1872709 RepID=UPI000E3E39C4|nr:4Fe-4S single cluster domain-containing protein [Allorhizocola rhizosphaerae]
MNPARTLRVNRTHFPVKVLGPGTRWGIWVQGCPLACRGCMSLDTWDETGGVEVSVESLAVEWAEAVDAGATGLTLSGGEPLVQPEAVAALLVAADRVRRKASRECDILVYTGFELSELKPEQLRAIEHADVLMTGRYNAAAPTRLLWRGSANQRMVMRTPLGRQRYAGYQNLVPDKPPIQVQVDESGAWIVGVPAPGTLPRLERQLRDGGLGTVQVSWRPSPPEVG